MSFPNGTNILVRELTYEPNPEGNVNDGTKDFIYYKGPCYVTEWRGEEEFIAEADVHFGEWDGVDVTVLPADAYNPNNIRRKNGQQIISWASYLESNEEVA